MGTVPAIAAPPPHADESVSQDTGIVRPSQAIGAVRARLGFTHFANDGGLAVCAEQKNWSADCKTYVPPAEYIKRQFPKREYVGFQIFVLKDGPQLYLYYR
ncbi:hypothetical protein WL29_20615 [Burkholderia ubonensis]|uniref:Uncharacterized protein n=2 Tax=Burkholderia ubonensis TaxID=101571 RepID=A0A106QB58_9BURK|nr:hypothetical protein WL29_20615 [Burkholderia ubonensis]